MKQNINISGCERAKSHTLYYETSPEIWQDGFPLGNGHFGGLVYQGEETVFETAVTRLDLGKENMTPFERLPIGKIKELSGNPDELKRLLENELSSWRGKDGKCDLPDFKPGGRLRLGLDEGGLDSGAGLFDKQQRLDISRGEVYGSYELSGKAMERQSVVDQENDVMATRFRDTYRHNGMVFPYFQRLELYRLYDPAAEIIKTGVTEDNIGYIIFGFREKLRAAIGFKVSGVPTQEPRCEERCVGMTLNLNYPGLKAGENIEFTVYLSVLVDRDGGKDLTEKLFKLLRKSEKRGFEAIAAANTLYWQNFWDKRRMCFSDSALEGLWYFSLYQFATTSRGGTAPGLFGLWNAERSAPWHGEYAGDINLSMTYWPVFQLNDPELFEPFFNTFDKITSTAIAETKRFYGIDGLRFPLCSGPKGEDFTPAYYRMMTCASGFYADCYWKWYLYYPDGKILRNRIFPVLYECSKYYLALCDDLPDGNYRIGPSWAPEQGPCPAWNVTNDLGLIKPLWKACVEAAKLLKLHDAVTRKIEKRLKNFPEYPSHNGELVDSETAAERTSLCHPGYFAPVVPGDDIDADSPLAPLVKKSLFEHLMHTERMALGTRIASGCDLSWGWMLATAVRLRERHFACQIIKDIAFDFIKPNGMFAFLPGSKFRSIEEKRQGYEVDGAAQHVLLGQTSNYQGRARMMSMVQCAGAFLFALNESMLQSHHNELKIFPSRLDILGFQQSFHGLRAQGAVLVSAGCDRHGICWVILEPELDYTGTLRFFDDADYEVFKLETFGGKTIICPPAGEHVWKINLQKGMRYVWQRSKDIVPGKDAVLVHEPGIRDYGSNTSTHFVSYGKRGKYFER